MDKISRIIGAQIIKLILSILFMLYFSMLVLVSYRELIVHII